MQDQPTALHACLGSLLRCLLCLRSLLLRGGRGLAPRRLLRLPRRLLRPPPVLFALHIALASRILHGLYAPILRRVSAQGLIQRSGMCSTEGITGMVWNPCWSKYDKGRFEVQWRLSSLPALGMGFWKATGMETAVGWQ